MPAISGLRVKQSTTTPGTGTITLLPATGTARSFQQGYGVSPVRVCYCLAASGAFEIGYGTFDGGSPGTLTRDTVIYSSNANALLSLSGVVDVFPVLDPAIRQVLESAATTLNLALADLGNLVLWTGTARGTVNLPAVATVPPGQGWMIRNAGTAALVLDGNASETIDGQTTLVLLPGTAIELWRIGSAWITSGPDVIGDIVTSGVASIEFTLPAAWSVLRLTIAGIQLASATAMSFQGRRTGQGSYDTGASTYQQSYVGREFDTAGNAVVSLTQALTSGLLFSLADASAAAPAHVSGILDMGAASKAAVLSSLSWSYAASPDFDILGINAIRMANNGKLDRIRFQASAGNINAAIIRMERLA
jgi:hypothetical protein